jgi:hypothetical protein
VSDNPSPTPIFSLGILSTGWRHDGYRPESRKRGKYVPSLVITKINENSCAEIGDLSPHATTVCVR